tara:strand:+ start:5204 stop:6310 length:1107 start_codon:yes stop_codon:yes gene_type:complete
MLCSQTVYALAEHLHRVDTEWNPGFHTHWHQPLATYDDDEDLPRLTFHEGLTEGTLIIVFVRRGARDGVAMGVIKHPLIIALVQEEGVYNAFQNMLFFDARRVHALVALLQMLDYCGGEIGIVDSEIVEADEVATLLFLIMWVSADGHDSLPFSTATNPTSAYYLLFLFCTSTKARFQMTEASIVSKVLSFEGISEGENTAKNAHEHLTTFGTAGMIYVRKIEGGEQIELLKVPATNYDKRLGPRRRLATDFVHFCMKSEAAEAAMEKAPHMQWPMLTYAFCNLNKFWHPFKTMYYEHGLQPVDKWVVWTVFLLFQRVRNFPQELVSHVLGFVPGACMFYKTLHAREDDYTADSAEDTDWDTDDSEDE